MKKKLKIGVLLGGKSTEHEVSLVTAKTIMGALDKNKYIVTPIKIGKNGSFDFNALKKVDVVFPVLHGPYGEDGTVQGMLKLIGVPFVGASVLGSAVGMDKDVMKKLLQNAGIPIGEYITMYKKNEISFEQARKKLGLPMFIKPANAGSSVGVSKAKNKKDFDKAVKHAFAFDTKVILEKAILGREIECGVIGNADPVASLPGEIIPQHEFYDYEAKYLDDNGAIYEIPAKLSPSQVKKIQSVAVKAYKVLNCEGFGRVDCFLRKDGEFLVNEINTIPGPVMFRRLWESTGKPFPKVLDTLIDLALKRHEKENKLKNTFV